MIGSNSSIFLYQPHDPPPVDCHPNVDPYWCLRIGDFHHGITVFGTLGKLQQFAASITAAVRDAVDVNVLVEHNEAEVPA